MVRILASLVFLVALVVGCERRPPEPPATDKVKVKVNAPGIDVEVEGKKK